MAELAALGVALPEEYRKENAMVGEWEVVQVIEPSTSDDTDLPAKGPDDDRAHADTTASARNGAATMANSIAAAPSSFLAKRRTMRGVIRRMKPDREVSFTASGMAMIHWSGRAAGATRF